MNEFSAAIAAFLAGHVGYAQLEATLASALRQDPTIAPVAFAEIDRVFKTGLLPLQIYVGLKSLIAQSSASTSQRPPPTHHPTSVHALRPHAPAEPASPAEATVFPSLRQHPLGSGSVLKHRFVLENEVGRGGMGVVFRAKDLRKEEAQDRDPYVAIKILNDEFRRHPESLKALQREARKSQQLAHPNIVSVFDFDRDGATVYMTMEFLEGQPLDRILKHPKFGGMSLADAYPLIRGIGSALAHAHDKGIVHSDFKPGNCFVTKSGTVKVFDFGIARASKVKSNLDGDVTKFDAGSLGALTPAYASSEMTAGDSPDPRDDIYGFACVIYEMLVGAHPFGRKPAAEARSAGLAARPIPKLSRRQWRALQNALAFRRADRTATVAEVVDGLAEEPRSRAPWRIASGAVALVLMAVAAYFGADIWRQQRFGDLAAALSSGDDARVMPALASLAEIDATRRSSVLNDVADPLLEWYERRIDAVADKDRGPYDFGRAAAIVDEAKALYPDSARLEELRRRKEDEAAALVKALEARLDAAFAAGRLSPDPRQDDVGDVIEILRQVDPTNSRLDRRRLVAEYTRRATEALRANDLARAKNFVDAGIARFPDEPSLRAVPVNSTASSNNARDRQPTNPPAVGEPAPAVAAPGVEAASAETNRRVDGIKSVFESFLQTGDALGARAARDQLRATLPANDPYLAEAASRMAELYLNIAGARFDAGDFRSARRAAEDGLRELPSSTALAALARLSADVDTLRTRIAGGAGDANADHELRERVRSDAGARFPKIDDDLIATAEQRVAWDPQDGAYVAYVAIVFERAFGGGASSAVTQPVPSAPPVSPPSFTSTPPAANNEPAPLVRIPPVYPARALSRGLEGWVRIRFTITATGTVADASVVDAEPKAIFDEAALQAIARWRYSPRVEDGLAVERPGVQTVIRFQLEQ